MAKEPPKFFAGFSFGRFVFKAVGLFFAFLAGGSAIADWSNWGNALRDAVRKQPHGIAIVFGVWMLAFFAYEVLRLKLRYDLAQARLENRRARRRGGHHK